MANLEKLQRVIEEQSVRTVFQPIISIKEKRVVGFEALTRGVEPETGEIIPPPPLFRAAQQLGMSLDFDRLCREKAVSAFARSESVHDHMLFLNFDPSILAQVIIGNGWMKRLVRYKGMYPMNVAIEIVESRVASQKSLIEFVELYRSFGFIIVLDDFGAQHSNLDRILLLKPDIIKIDRELVHEVSEDFCKQSIVGSIVGLADKLGTLILAEGVERIEDIIKCYELGINLFQGFHFARPVPIDQISDGFCSDIISKVSDNIFHHLSADVARQVESQDTYEKIMAILCGKLSGISPDVFDVFSKNHISQYPRIQCLYILNSDGRQVSHTICKSGALFRPNHPLFNPAVRGADHSLKSYFYYMQILKLDKFFTDPYTSLATGTICRTMSAKFRDCRGDSFILCIDFEVSPDKVALSGSCCI